MSKLIKWLKTKLYVFLIIILKDLPKKNLPVHITVNITN